ncbi:hypothetical protein C8R42DRAFT_646714 [Lentinula raphanica]|nr:hypothetical protein C8R42DRAFT_646714 [Lentinula raphanica]
MNEHLLSALGEHRNVRTILVPRFPDIPSTVSTNIALPKILLHILELAAPMQIAKVESHFVGMQIARISFVHAPSFFQEHLMSFDWDRFDWKPFNGIRELSLKMGYHPAALPWLPHFVSAHCPGLQKIEFVDKMDTYFSQRDEPVNPFVVCFNEEVDQEQSKGMDMLAFNMRRTRRPIYKYPEQWDVSDLDLFVRSSLHQLLAIIGTCYRNIVVLDLEFGDDTSTYDVPWRSYDTLRDEDWVVEDAGTEVAVQVDVVLILPVTGQLEFGSSLGSLDNSKNVVL